MKATDLQKAKEVLEQMHRNPSQVTSSGYPSLDSLMGGIIKGGVTLIGGRIAMGRSSLALNMVRRLADKKEGTILFISTRFSGKDIAARLLSMGLKMPLRKLFDGSVPPKEKAVRYLDCLQAQKSNIKISWYTNPTLDSIQHLCDGISDLQLVVVDGLENIYEPVEYMASPMDFDEPREPMDKILEFLKGLARYRDIPVIGTVNMHRSLEIRKNKRPKLSDMAKIHVPTELSDQIIFLYRDRYYDPFGDEKAELIVAKNDLGGTGTVVLDWDHETYRFDEISGNT